MTLPVQTPRSEAPRPFARRILLPEAPAMVLRASGAIWLSPDGDVETIGFAEARRRLEEGAQPILCHARAISRRFGIAIAGHDLLELFAFVRPARFVAPTPRGLALAAGLDPAETAEGEAAALFAVSRALLSELSQDRSAETAAIARVMASSGWEWGPAVLAALGEGPEERAHTAALEIWRRLPEWSEHAPPPPPGSEPVSSTDTRTRLARLLGANAEARPSQADYASAVAAAFNPREREGEPHVVLAEAGTGVGKTLGYVAPASLWAEKNEGSVWFSTYTRNLQHQIDGELDRLYPDPADKALNVVIRKGRENYLCLLNFEEALRGLKANPDNAVALGLLARWGAATRDGDMVGGDFPGWLADLVGRGRTLGLTDRRGECVYAACPHYQKCFIERAQRRSRRARLVVGNHALVMNLAANGGLLDGSLSQRLVFDEGHHVFDAADSAFSLALSGQEAVELKRWVRGPEGSRRSRGRGLQRRLEDLVIDDAAGTEALTEAIEAARVLPAEGWMSRVAEGEPHGPAEAFLALVRQQVFARAQDTENAYSIEADAKPPGPGLAEAAERLMVALGDLRRPMIRLRDRLKARLDEDAEELDAPMRLRLDAMARSLDRRIKGTLDGWRAMLDSIASPTPPDFVDWFQVDRAEGRDLDVGMQRHYVDPTEPLAEMVFKPAHGVVVTSATLRDATGETEEDWLAAEALTGARHLTAPALRAAVASPFDYARQTRIFVVTDVDKTDFAQVAAAYRTLFLAAGGGGLGLFTAIRRLREVQARIAKPLEDAGIPLYAQHVDGMDTATLIDIFRAEKSSCLLGTDAVRDGVDVPGRSLRLIVFDRVPWPRPDILHRARRQAFGAKAYDERVTRFRLKQAFGRLIRRADDTGVFVMLDKALPSRLAAAFPEGAQVVRMGLAEAVAETRAFLAQEPAPVDAAPLADDAIPF
jgi:ATP-dependent DNA helicase DinG